MPNFRRTIAAGGFLLLGASALPVAARAADSAYTTFNADACTELSRQEEGEGVEMRCPGFKGVPVFFSEGDLRTDVDFGAPDGVFSTFGYFNTVAGTFEWRHAGGKPFAVIVRYKIDSGDGEPKSKGDVLLVAKVGNPQQPGCPMAAVDVSTVEQPNGVARGVAALAPGFDCATTKPIAIGAPNSLAARFTEAVPEGRRSQ